MKKEEMEEAKNIWLAMKKAGDFVREHSAGEDEIVEDEAMETEIATLAKALKQIEGEVLEEALDFFETYSLSHKVGQKIFTIPRATAKLAILELKSLKENT